MQAVEKKKVLIQRYATLKYSISISIFKNYNINQYHVLKLSKNKGGGVLERMEHMKE